MQPAGFREEGSRASRDPPATASSILSLDRYRHSERHQIEIMASTATASPRPQLEDDEEEDIVMVESETAVSQAASNAAAGPPEPPAEEAPSQQSSSGSYFFCNRATTSTPPPTDEADTLATDYQALGDEVPSTSKDSTAFGRWTAWFRTTRAAKVTDSTTDPEAVQQEPDQLMKEAALVPSPKNLPLRIIDKIMAWPMMLFAALRDSGDGGELPEEDDEPKTWPRRIICILCSAYCIVTVMFLFMTAGLTYGVYKQYGWLSLIDWNQQIHVAFAGSAYLFVNDAPRLLEAVAGGQVIQDSCLHAGGSLAAVIMTGNGMYNRWQTAEASINVEDSPFYSGYANIYDYGACSVHQLITGTDNYIEYGNGNKAYYNDGSNPCIQDENYYDYVTAKYAYEPPQWDYVVLADQSKRMTSGDARYDSVDALVSVYGPLLAKTSAKPVIVDTHAFWSSQTNMTGLYNVSTFTSMIYEGVDEYVEALAAVLPAEQAPIVVPIGLAYLAIWEDNYDLWTKLFLSDQMHASLSGSYLFAVVLYTTLFGHLPKKDVSMPEHYEYLFQSSRKIVGQSVTYPSASEAAYLRHVAKKVVLDKYVPKTLVRSYQEDANDETFADDDDETFGGRI